MRILKDDLLKSARDEHNKSQIERERDIKEKSENDLITRNIQLLQEQLAKTKSENDTAKLEIQRLKENEIKSRQNVTELKEENTKVSESARHKNTMLLKLQ